MDVGPSCVFFDLQSHWRFDVYKFSTFLPVTDLFCDVCFICDWHVLCAQCLHDLELGFGERTLPLITKACQVADHSGITYLSHIFSSCAPTLLGLADRLRIWNSWTAWGCVVVFVTFNKHLSNSLDHVRQTWTIFLPKRKGALFKFVSFFGFADSSVVPSVSGRDNTVYCVC